MAFECGQSHDDSLETFLLSRVRYFSHRYVWKSQAHPVFFSEHKVLFVTSSLTSHRNQIVSVIINDHCTEIRSLNVQRLEKQQIEFFSKTFSHDELLNRNHTCRCLWFAKPTRSIWNLLVTESPLEAVKPVYKQLADLLWVKNPKNSIDRWNNEIIFRYFYF